jgi:hypothetical protein
VGGNASAVLRSITAFSVTQSAPSSSGDTIFNYIDGTRAFDFVP